MLFQVESHYEFSIHRLHISYFDLNHITTSRKKAILSNILLV